MINAIQTYNSTQTICDELYPEGVFMTNDLPSGIYSLFKAAPIVYSSYLSLTESRMGVITGFVTNFIVTYLSDCFARGFRNLAIEQAQGMVVDFTKGFSLKERDLLPQNETMEGISIGISAFASQTIINERRDRLGPNDEIQYLVKGNQALSLVWWIFRASRDRFELSDELRRACIEQVAPDCGYNAS